MPVSPELVVPEPVVLPEDPEPDGVADVPRRLPKGPVIWLPPGRPFTTDVAVLTAL